MKITIFGSCRQVPINKYYSLTDIQEHLTYPHYTKEIIQAIQFCKNESNVPLEDTKYCFRTGILNNKVIHNQDELINQFNNTDIFLVEIASKINYKWRNYYLHHICTESKYNFPFRNDINIYDATDKEIEDDILEIKKLLDPKPFIIISHISTYEGSKRDKLCTLLEHITSKHNIPFYNPSNLLKSGYTKESLFVSERVLSHYTKFGESIIADKYKELIDDIMNKHK